MNLRPGTLFLGGAIVLALATAYFFYDYLRTVSQPKVSPKRAVVMARADIPARQVVTEQMVGLLSIPAEMALTNSISDPKEVVGKWTVVPIKQHEQVRRSDIADKNKVPGLAPSIPEGMRAITIGISDTTAVAGAIFPGDHVDIIANVKDPRHNGAMVQLPLQNIEVMAIDRAKRDTTEGATSSLTLLTTPQQAQLINMAVEAGPIRVMLRARDDKQISDSQGVNLDDFLRRPQTTEAPGPTKVEPPPAPPTPAKPRTFKVYDGATLKEFEVNK